MRHSGGEAVNAAYRGFQLGGPMRKELFHFQLNHHLASKHESVSNV